MGFLEINTVEEEDVQLVDVVGTATGGNSVESFCALDSKGQIYFWGAAIVNPSGLGVNRSVPGRAVPDRRFSSISARSRYYLALDLDGYAWAWGDNSAGNLGNGTALNQNAPVSVLGGRKFSAFSPSYYPLGTSALFSVALDLDGYAWAWGAGTSGQLGDGTTASKSSPVSVLGGRRFQQVITCNSYCVALDLDGYAWAWGSNLGGSLGDGTVINRSSPVSVLGGRRFQKIGIVGGTTSSTLALDLNGYAWAWGNNSSGQLGDTTLTGRSSPVSVLGGIRFSKFAPVVSSDSPSVALALDLNGYAWAWGSNSAGVLGDGTDALKSSPVSVLGGRRFQDVAFSSSTSVVALDLDGYAWAWGQNTLGLLGDGTLVSKSSPVSVLGGRTFNKIATSRNQICLVNTATNNTAAFGSGASGALGNGSDANQSSPVSVFLRPRANPKNILGK